MPYPKVCQCLVKTLHLKSHPDWNMTTVQIMSMSFWLKSLVACAYSARGSLVIHSQGGFQKLDPQAELRLEKDINNIAHDSVAHPNI